MIRRIAICTGLLLLSIQTPASATSVQALLNMCNSSSEANQTVCVAAVAATMEMMTSNGVILHKIPASEIEARGWLALTGVCANAKGISGALAVQAFKNWGSAHPEAWSSDQQYGLMKALSATWPCNP